MVRVSNGQALAGVRILDLSGHIAGWVAGMVMGDFGAEIVHVDPPDRAGAAEIPGEAMWHRNKVCVSADWSSDVDLGNLRALVAGADMCITTDARVCDLLDLEHPGNDRLVHLHMPSGVPLASGGLEVDTMVSASFGVARRQSSFDGGPIDSVYPFVLYSQGLWGATAAVAALIERENSGLGQRLEVDGLHGVLVAHTGALVIEASAEPLTTAVGPGGRAATFTTFRCSDGHWLFFAATSGFRPAAFEILGISDLLVDPRLRGLPANLDAPDNRDWVHQILVDAFAKRPRDYWLEKLEEVGCPVGAVRDRNEWLDDPRVVAIGQRKTLVDPVDGEVAMGGIPLQLHGSPASEPKPRSLMASSDLPKWAPQGGERALRGGSTSAGANGPLDGIRVVNLGVFAAGPLAGVFLADLGADVAKVERRDGSHSRDAGFQLIRGQRSLAVDLHERDGHAAFIELAKRADVVIDNFRPGVMERLGIDYASLVPHRPDIISVSATGFGTVGPYAGRPAVDPILQAISGMMAAQGGDSDPVFFSLGINDAAAALSAAYGACLALFHRARTGAGQRVETSLCAASVFSQSGELLRYHGRPPARVGGRDFPGPTATDRFYSTADGFVRVFSESRDPWVRAGFLPDASISDEAAVTRIQEKLGSLSREQALDLLESAGVLAVAARHFRELPADESIIAGRYLAIQESVDGRSLHLPGRFARFSRTERQDALRTPGIGEHSRELLAEAGLTTEAIEAAITSGIVAEGPPVLWFSEVAGQY